MRSLILHLIIAITVLSWNSCTVFKKTISKPVTIAYNDSEFQAKVYSNAFNPKYTWNISSEELSEAFLSNFKSEASSTQNVTLVNSPEGADYILRLKSLNISESSKTEKVSDDKSPYNGMEVVLNSVECSAEFEITDTRNKSKKLLNCYNSKSRTEKLKNNRDAGDLIFGTNKDKTEYRTKLLTDNVCKNLAQDVGRRIWVPITRRISNNMK
jgi:hypothetical protein